MSIQSAQIDSGFRLNEAPAQAPERAEGLFMGARVVQDDPMSLLADAAEELTFSLAETEENRLDERKEKAEVRGKKDVWIDAARKLVQEADEKFGRAVDTLERLFKARNGANLSELMEALSQAREDASGQQDPAEQFALLVALKDRLGAEHPLAATLDEALEELAGNEASAISTGLAADAAAPAFPGLGEKGALRSAYRSAVADFTSPRDALTRLCANFGEERLEQGIDFLMTALGNELSAAGPSVDKAHLKALTGDLAAARVLGIVRDRCAALLARDAARGASSAASSTSLTSPANPDKLLDALLAARENTYVGPNDFQRMVALAGPPDSRNLEQEVLFLQDMLETLRGLPDLFYDGDARARVQNAAQAALDDAVRREEEALGF